VKIEQDLMSLLPEAHWIRYNQQIITHGREICTARFPNCTQCPLLPHCDEAQGLHRSIKNQIDPKKELFP
jgi:endonuclease-3